MSVVGVCLGLIVGNIRNYHIGKPLLDSSNSVVEIDEPGCKDVTTRFAVDLMGTRLRKLARREEFVRTRGQFLATRHERGCRVVLYHLGGFFAEVWYSPEDNQIALVHDFNSMQLLEPYLETIDLEELHAVEVLTFAL
jgi:hypothetical protein